MKMWFDYLKMFSFLSPLLQSSELKVTLEMVIIRSRSVTTTLDTGSKHFTYTFILTRWMKCSITHSRKTLFLLRKVYISHKKKDYS